MGVQGKNGVPRIGEPPQDGREWICRDDAIKLFDCSMTTLRKYLKRFGWETYCPPDGSQLWIVKKEVVFWANFLKERDRWRKRRRPEHRQMEYMMVDEKTAKEIFLTSAQVAAILKVSVGMVRQLTQRGRLPVHPSKKVGRGSRYWYSPTAIKNYLEDEHRIKWRAVYEKGMETRRRRKQGLEYKPVKSHRKYKGIPEGWLMAWEVAEKMGITECSVWRLRRKGHLEAQRFPKKRGRMSPWCFHESTVEAYLKEESYLQFRRKWDEREPKEEVLSDARVYPMSLRERLADIDAAHERFRAQMPW